MVSTQHSGNYQLDLKEMNNGGGNLTSAIILYDFMHEDAYRLERSVKEKSLSPSKFVSALRT
jgi:hypothetical protein